MTSAVPPQRRERSHQGREHRRPDDPGCGLCYAFAAMPCSTAQTAACTRLVRSSLRRMCWTWILTVLSATSSSRAISLLLAPRARKARISRSRGLNAGCAGGRSAGAHFAHQLGRHLRRHHRFALGRAAHGIDEEIALDVLEQIAEGAAAKRQHQVVGLLGDGEHHDVRARCFLEDRVHRVDAGNAGHVQVEQHDVRAACRDGP